MTKEMTTTRLQVFADAIADLTKAFDALDQAHASLRDLGYEDELPTPGKVNIYPNKTSERVPSSRLLSVSQLAASTYALIQELELRSECSECGHPIALHQDKYGCQHERGDGYRGDSNVEEALGPCGCEYWHGPANAQIV